MVLKFVFLVRSRFVFRNQKSVFKTVSKSVFKKISSTTHFSLQRMKTNETVASSELYSCIRQ